MEFIEACGAYLILNYVAEIDIAAVFLSISWTGLGIELPPLRVRSTGESSH